MKTSLNYYKELFSSSKGYLFSVNNEESLFPQGPPSAMSCCTISFLAGLFSRLLEYLKVSSSGRGWGCTLKVQHTIFPSPPSVSLPSCVAAVWIMTVLLCSVLSDTQSSSPFLLSCTSAVLQHHCGSCRCEALGLKCMFYIAPACIRCACHNDKVHLAST